MISKLPKWIEIGAFILALIAGLVNAVGLLGLEQQSVSHLSGSATLLGTGIYNAPILTVFHLLGVLLSFLMGSALAGFLLHGSTLKLGRHYDTALMIEGLWLFLAMWSLSRGSYWGHFFASAACGLQNALATTYSGAIVRTTHVTGIFTDLGIMLGQLCRGESLDIRKAKLFLLIIAGFILGGTCGAYLYSKFEFMALAFPASVCVVIALVYRVYNQQRKLGIDS